MLAMLNKVGFNIFIIDEALPASRHGGDKRLFTSLFHTYFT